MMELDAHKPKLVDHEATESETSIVELLINADEELKGKQQIIVDRETLVNTTRVHNKALLFIHNQLESLQDKLDSLNELCISGPDHYPDLIYDCSVTNQLSSTQWV